MAKSLFEMLLMPSNRQNGKRKRTTFRKTRQILALLVLRLAIRTDRFHMYHCDYDYLVTIIIISMNIRIRIFAITCACPGAGRGRKNSFYELK